MIEKYSPPLHRLLAQALLPFGTSAMLVTVGRAKGYGQDDPPLVLAEVAGSKTIFLFVFKAIAQEKCHTLLGITWCFPNKEVGKAYR